MLLCHRNFWVAALRSGLFKQGKSWLTSITDTGEERDCCLAVACKIFGVKRIRVEPINTALPNIVSAARYWDDDNEDGERQVLPNQLRRLFSLDRIGHLTGLFDRNDGEVSLAVLNDAEFTFDQIADIIEHWVPITNGDVPEP